MTKKPPTVTDAELRATGFSSNARNFPRSEAGARWIAAFNGILFEQIPNAWWYASNQHMLDYVEKRANGKTNGPWWWNFRLPKLPDETDVQNQLRTNEYITANSPPPSMPPRGPVTTFTVNSIVDSDEIPF